MGSPAPHATAGVTAEPVPVAILARTSTASLQDPVASVSRQIRSCRAWLPAGWFVAAVYSDVESGGTDLDKRSLTDSWRILTDAGLPRDGGMADLLREAGSPSPRFAVVVCEDIERSARDTFNALKLEKELSRQGIPLFATDEPADIAGINSTAILVRRVKQGVAEWYRIQLKEKIWKGFVEHNAEGWNIGAPPHGYAAEKHPHPNPYKAAQGATKTRLIEDPAEAPAIKDIYRWRVTGKLGVPTITSRLNASPATYPPPAGKPSWSAAGVYAILSNPKYTGYMVFGRHRTVSGHRVSAPRDQWLWSPRPAHPALVDRGTWEAAQSAGAEHATSRDGTRPNPAGRIYPYRGRVRCKACTRRMGANPFPSFTYYRCPHNPGDPRHAAAHPGHPRTVQVPDTLLDKITGPFIASRILSPQRAALAAAQLPADTQAAASRRDHQAAALTARIRKLDTAQNAQITALEDIPDDSPAAPAMRARIRDRFAQLHADRTRAEADLAALAAAAPKVMDLSLLDELPLAGDILPGLPPALKARLFAAIDLSILWDKAGNQATVTAVITDATLAALPGILDPGQDGYDDTNPDNNPSLGQLVQSPRATRDAHVVSWRASDAPWGTLGPGPPALDSHGWLGYLIGR